MALDSVMKALYRCYGGARRRYEGVLQERCEGAMMALDGVMTVLQGRYESAMKALDWRYGGARWRYEGFIQVPSKRYTDAIRMLRWHSMAL